MKKAREGCTGDSRESNTASGAFAETVGKHRLQSIVVRSALFSMSDLCDRDLHHVTASHEQRFVSIDHPIVEGKLEEKIFSYPKGKIKKILQKTNENFNYAGKGNEMWPLTSMSEKSR